MVWFTKRHDSAGTRARPATHRPASREPRASGPQAAQRVLRDPFADLVAMEAVVRGSGLDWTVLRPPRLTDKPLTGHYRTRRELNVRRGIYLSRADLAHLILAVCGDPDTYRTAIFAAR